MAIIKFKDADIEIGALNISQRLDHIKYLRKQIIDDAKTYMSGLPLQLCLAIWNKATADAKAIDIGSDAFMEATHTYESYAYALVLSVIKAIPTFNLHDALSVIETDPEKILRIIRYEVLKFAPINPGVTE